MRIICPTKELKQVLQQVARVAPANNAISILSHVKLQAIEGGHIIISSSDYDLEMQCIAPGVVDHEGAVTLPAKQFSDIVSHMPGDTVTVEAKNYRQSTVYSGNSTYKLSGLEPDSFPQMPLLSEPGEFNLVEGELLEALEVTAHAIGDNENRPATCGLLFDIIPSGLTLVATNEHVLALARLPTDIDWEEQLCVPKRAIQELKRLLLPEDRPLWVRFDSNQVLFSTSRFRLASRLIAGAFPNWRKLVQMERPITVELNASCLLDAVKRLQSLAREDIHRLHFQFSADVLKITAKSQDLGEGEEFMPCGYSGDDMGVFLNGKYVQNAVQSLQSETVLLRMTDGDRPISLSPPDPSYYCPIIAPMFPWPN